VIVSGTPADVGVDMAPKVYLKAGDLFEASIDDHGNHARGETGDDNGNHVGSEPGDDNSRT
jgi:hypothetical protein